MFVCIIQFVTLKLNSTDALKKWKAGGSKEIYLEAKRKANLKVFAAKKQAEEERFLNILRRDDQKDEIFKITKQM